MSGCLAERFNLWNKMVVSDMHFDRKIGSRNQIFNMCTWQLLKSFDIPISGVSQGDWSINLASSNFVLKIQLQQAMMTQSPFLTWSVIHIFTTQQAMQSAWQVFWNHLYNPLSSCGQLLFVTQVKMHWNTSWNIWSDKQVKFMLSLDG